jgi:acyl CoA:acetate/3-ketoacid CoA transferase beta subunit
MKYTPTELMACSASAILEDKTSALVGTGLPIIAGLLAQRSHAPNLLIVFEAGAIGAQVPVLPISVGDSRTENRAVIASSMHEVMSMSQAGYVDYGFLGAAQIDMYGNINTTVIGDYYHPKVRLPGSGGANDVGSFSHRTIILMRQDKKRFVEKVDFITTPGYLTGPGAREKAGLPANTGPYRVVTQLGIYAFDDESKKMKLLALSPGVSIEDVRNGSSFEILIPEKVETIPEPSEEQLKILHDIDPVGIVIR